MGISKKQQEATEKASGQSVPLTDSTATIAPCATSVAHEILPPALEELNITAVRNLTDERLIAAMKQQYALTNSSYSLFRRDKDILAVLYDEMVDRFRDQHLAGGKRDGKPTLREAFERAGWNYNAARKFRQRHENEKNLLPAYETSAKPLQLTAGELIKDKDGIEGVARPCGYQSTEIEGRPLSS